MAKYSVAELIEWLKEECGTQFGAHPRVSRYDVERFREVIECLGKLGESLKFVTYIKNRYEQGWDDPITERFYSEACALLGADVERRAANCAGCEDRNAGKPFDWNRPHVCADYMDEGE